MKNKNNDNLYITSAVFIAQRLVGQLTKTKSSNNQLTRGKPRWLCVFTLLITAFHRCTCTQVSLCKIRSVLVDFYWYTNYCWMIFTHIITKWLHRSCYYSSPVPRPTFTFLSNIYLTSAMPLLILRQERNTSIKQWQSLQTDRLTPSRNDLQTVFQHLCCT